MSEPLVAVDAHNLARPRSGVEVYLENILRNLEAPGLEMRLLTDLLPAASPPQPLEVVPVPFPPVFHDRAIGLLPLGVEAETLQAALAALVEGLSVGLPAWFNRVGSSTVSEWGLPVGEERLTRREVEVLEQLAQGLTNKQIARTLGISEHTVKYHISAIYAKLGVMNRAEAVRVGARRGYVQI